MEKKVRNRIKTMLSGNNQEMQDLGMVLLKAHMTFEEGLELMKEVIHSPLNILFDVSKGVSSLEIERPWNPWKMNKKVTMPLFTIDPTKTLSNIVLVGNYDTWKWEYQIPKK